MGAKQSTDLSVPVDYTEVPNFVNADGLHIYTKCWPSSSQPVRGLVFLAHGLGEHCGRETYDDFAKQLSAIGVTVISHDHVGHGRSQGARGIVKKFSVYVRDVIQHIESKRQELPDVPVVLVGHSMGGTISFLSALEHRSLISGIILSAPSLKPMDGQRPGAVAHAGLRLLASVSGGTAVARPNPVEYFTRDPELQEQEDPLCLPRTGTKAGFAYPYMQAIGDVEKNLSKLDIPFLVVHGTNDHLTNIDGSRQFYEQSPSTDKTFKEIPDAVHNLLMEVKECRDEVSRLIVEWLDTRLTKWSQSPGTDQAPADATASSGDTAASPRDTEASPGDAEVSPGDAEVSRGGAEASPEGTAS